MDLIPACDCCWKVCSIRSRLLIGFSVASFPDVPQIIVLPSPGTLQLFLFAIYFVWWQSSSSLSDTVIMLNQAR